MALDYHIPALLTESIQGLNVKPGGVYVDATFGGGGHSRAIVQKLDNQGHLYGFDQDTDASANSIDDPRFTFVLCNFKFVKNYLRFYDVDNIDGLIADLGVSSHHFDTPQRGFSFREDGPLDMRMNNTAEKTAQDVLNTLSVDELADAFRTLGELNNTRRLAQAIIYERNNNQHWTTLRLVETVSPLLDKKNEKKELAKIFQTLRIIVNNELEALKTLLYNCVDIIRPGGRLVVISYHSLEDRLIKNFLKTGNFEGVRHTDIYGNANTPFKLLNSKTITPSLKEIEENPRVRSAKMRIGLKL